MKVASLTLRKIHIPFRFVFKHFLKSSSEVNSVILEIRTDCGKIGYGECVPRDYVTGETLESVERAVRVEIAPTIGDTEFRSPADIDQFLSRLGEKDPCARAATELALLDALGRATSTWVGDLLGGAKRTEIGYSAVIGSDRPILVKSLLKQIRSEKIRVVKLKVGRDLETDLKNISLCQQVLGPELSLRVDGNGSWTLAEAEYRLPRFAKMGVVSFEQPLPVSAVADYPALMRTARGLGVFVSLDESLVTESDARRMIDSHGANLFNLRVSKNGGLLPALRIHAAAKAAGIQCQLGAQVGETSILSSAGRILAAVTGDFVYHEGSFGTRLLANDLTDSGVGFGSGGIGNVEKKPGLGVDVNLRALTKMTQEKIELVPGR